MGKVTGVVVDIDSRAGYPLEVNWDEGGFEVFTVDGRVNTDHTSPALELVERVKRKVKKEVHGWVNIYPDFIGAVHSDKIKADNVAHYNRITCVELKGEYEVEE